MRSDKQLQNLESALQAYLDGRTGVRYEILVEFAEPLFYLFELDLRSASRVPKARRLDELSTLLALLDTARLFWAYFQLPESAAVDALPELRQALLGPKAGADERRGLADLLAELGQRCAQLRCPDEPESGTPGYSLPAFDELLKAYGSAAEPPGSEPDALALFARPLFEAVDVQDTGAVEDAFARAQAYWDLAHLRGEEYERQLQEIARRFAGLDRNSEDVRREAEQMAVRFRSLFS